MTTAGANPTGQKQDDIRTLFFGQQSINTQWGGANIITNYFPGTQQFSKARLSLARISLFNSWYNITAARGNNGFIYQHPENGTYATHVVSIPDGSYETMEEINEYFQKVLYANGDYLIYYDEETGTSTITYFYQFSTSPSLYAYVLTITTLPATINTGLPTDASHSGYYQGEGNVTPANEGNQVFLTIETTSAPAGSSNPQQYSFSKTTGFSPATYASPSGVALGVSTYTSNFAPQIQYTSVINVACNLVNQLDVNPNPNVFYQFVPNAPFGELISETPPYPIFVPVGDAYYRYIQITLLDDNLNPLQMIDPVCYGYVIVQG